MTTIWHWIQGLWSKLRPNSSQGAFSRFLNSIDGLEGILRFVALMVIAVLVFVGLLDFLGKLTLTPYELAGAGVFVLLCIVVAIIAQLESDARKNPAFGSPTAAPRDPLKAKVLSFIATHDALSVEDIAQALNAQVDQVNDSCTTLLSELRLGQAAGQYYITEKGREYLRDLDR